ncbi:MAG: UV DNA damage repair endonuclease UvsE, partial [Verrucomicrobiaceae bacterium]
NLGFACVLSDGSLSTNHTFRLASLSPAKLAEAAHQNMDDLERMLEFMEQGPLRLLRLGGSMVPLASHERVDFDWRPLVAGRLRAIGNTFAARGFRFSSHPGQYTILNATDDGVVRRAIAELAYSVQLLDLMELDDSHKVVIHGGGIYGDREAATSRLVDAVSNLPERIKARLVLENDERLFNLEQILWVAERGGVPVVFDLHHHQINPGEGDLHELLLRVRRTWNCRPKIHMSSQKPNARTGAHDDLLHEKDLQTMLEVIPFDTDVMVESKGKEVAALHAWKWLRDHVGLAN